MPNMQDANVGYYTSITEQNIHVAFTKHTSGCTMNKGSYQFEQHLKESIAKDIDRFKELFKNKKDIEIAKKIIRGQA